MKKQLDETRIINELEGASLFFPKNKETQKRIEKERDTDDAGGVTPYPRTPVPSEPRNPVPAEPRTGMPVLPTKRKMKHHPFDVYQDQIDTLKRIALDETIAGGAGSMSRMVREAIEEYLARKKQHLKK